MNYSKIDQIIEEESGLSLVFSNLVSKLTSMESVEPQGILNQIKAWLLGCLPEQKELFWQLTAIIVVYALAEKICEMIGESGFQKYGNYIFFMSASAVVLHSYQLTYNLLEHTIGTICNVMTAILPAYCISIFVVEGDKSAGGYYGFIVVAIYICQQLVLKLFLPLTKWYIILQLVNAGLGEERFSRFAETIYDLIKVSLKIMVATVTGFQIMQSLLFPTMDRYLRAGVTRGIMMIPGIGNMTEQGMKLVIGAAALIKNAIGYAGIVAILLISAWPVIQIIAPYCVIRICESVYQPVSSKGMIRLLEGMRLGYGLMLRILISVILLFLISIAVVAAVTNGG